MSSPLWVLPCRTITSGAGFTAGSTAVNVRVTPLMVIVSANAELAQHNTAAAATHRNFVGIGFHPASIRQSRSYKWFRALS